MLYSRVPLITASDVLAYRVGRALRTHGLDVRRVASAAEIQMLPKHDHSVLVLTVPALRQAEVSEAVDEIRTLQYDLSFVLLAHSEELTLADHSSDQCDICLLPFELGILPRRILRLRFECWRTQVVRRIRAAGQLPYALREALVSIVRQQMPPAGVAGRRLRTVGAIARHVGVSRGHLSRTANAQKWNLPKLADGYLAVLALYSHEVGGHSWDAVAWRLGYQSQAGLNRVMMRAAGAGLRSGLTLERAMAAWEAQLNDHGVGL